MIPLESRSCHVETGDDELLIGWDLMKVEEVVDLKQPVQNIVPCEQRDLKFRHPRRGQRHGRGLVGVRGKRS